MQQCRPRRRTCGVASNRYTALTMGWFGVRTNGVPVAVSLTSALEGLVARTANVPAAIMNAIAADRVRPRSRIGPLVMARLHRPSTRSNQPPRQDIRSDRQMKAYMRPGLSVKCGPYRIVPQLTSVPSRSLARPAASSAALRSPRGHANARRQCLSKPRCRKRTLAGRSGQTVGPSTLGPVLPSTPRPGGGCLSGTTANPLNRSGWDDRHLTGIFERACRAQANPIGRATSLSRRSA
jgi:hypothetical protein